MRARAALLAIVAVAGLTLTGCDRGTTASAPTVSSGNNSSTDQLGSLEASVDAISRQVDSDAAG